MCWNSPVANAPASGVGGAAEHLLPSPHPHRTIQRSAAQIDPLEFSVRAIINLLLITDGISRSANCSLLYLSLSETCYRIAEECNFRGSDTRFATLLRQPCPVLKVTH